MAATGGIGGRRPFWRRVVSKRTGAWAYPELGMEAVWKLKWRIFPAFILVDDKGNDFFPAIQSSQCALRTLSNGAAREW